MSLEANCPGCGVKVRMKDDHTLHDGFIWKCHNGYCIECKVWIKFTDMTEPVTNNVSTRSK